jgi:hypothetical protein
LRNEIQNIIDSLCLPSKDFTRELKSFYKAMKCSDSRWGMKLETEEAVRIFEACSPMILDESVPNDRKYNAFRLIKQAVLERDFVKMKGKLSESYGLFTYGILHPNGNIRNEAFNYFVDLDMGCSSYLNPDEAFEKEYWIIASNVFFHLRWMHDEYERINSKNLRKRDCSTKKTMPWSYDTEDPFLKALRRYFERIEGPRFHEALMKYGIANVVER